MISCREQQLFNTPLEDAHLMYSLVPDLHLGIKPPAECIFPVGLFPTAAQSFQRHHNDTCRAADDFPFVVWPCNLFIFIMAHSSSAHDTFNLNGVCFL